jgi:hypothetical protein
VLLNLQYFPSQNRLNLPSFSPFCAQIVPNLTRAGVRLKQQQVEGHLNLLWTLGTSTPRYYLACEADKTMTSTSRQCEHRLPNGKRCRAHVRTNDRFCFFHSAATLADRGRAAASRRCCAQPERGGTPWRHPGSSSSGCRRRLWPTGRNDQPSASRPDRSTSGKCSGLPGEHPSGRAASRPLGGGYGEA